MGVAARGTPTWHWRWSSPDSWEQALLCCKSTPYADFSGYFLWIVWCNRMRVATHCWWWSPAPANQWRWCTMCPRQPCHPLDNRGRLPQSFRCIDGAFFFRHKNEVVTSPQHLVRSVYCNIRGREGQTMSTALYFKHDVVCCSVHAVGTASGLVLANLKMHFFIIWKFALKIYHYLYKSQW